MNRCQQMLTACDPPLTQEEGQAVWDQMKALEFHRGPFTPGLMFWVLPPATMFFTAPVCVVLGVRSVIAPMYALLIWLCTGVLALLVCEFTRRRNARRNQIELGRLLRERGIRVRLCGRCSYDLRSITRASCPECGEPIAT